MYRPEIYQSLFLPLEDIIYWAGKYATRRKKRRIFFSLPPFDMLLILPINLMMLFADRQTGIVPFAIFKQKSLALWAQTIGSKKIVESNTSTSGMV